MTIEDHRQVAGTLLDLVQEMEQILKDYCRLLTANDDGHRLEQNESDKDPF
ncbi:MAG: hypothetical protein KAT62_09740 [Desulfuromonadales bacterium]|nr:hypothetical protein [Desulfuromonadales bacterium]